MSATKAYAPKWMSGTEALKHLASVESEPRACFRLLQSAIKDEAILARARGRERDREYFWNQGLSSDKDFALQVDNPWRSHFVLSDPNTVDLDLFGEQSEILREDVEKVFGKVKPIKKPASHKTASQSEAKSLIAKHIKAESDAGRTATLAGLEKVAAEHQWNVRRETLRKLFREHQTRAGAEPRRGRPPKIKP